MLGGYNLLENNISNYDKEKEIYLSHLIGKIMKILYLYEDYESIVPQVYTEGLMINIDSANKMFDGVLIEILVKLNEINFKTMEHKDIRKRVLESTNMADKLLKKVKI
jgi:hypothetical protein